MPKLRGSQINPQRILLEVCIASVEDARAAADGGADRLELNYALALGGLTPSIGLFAEVRRAVSLPIVAMLRPRQGGFVYTPSEFDVMRRDAQSLLEAGADGLAFGVLTESGELDLERNRQLRDLCGNREAVFHRAFDWTRDPKTSLEQLIELDFTRVMTSGQQATAADGISLIAELVRQASDRTVILPAAGINAHNVHDVVSRTGCQEVHASLRKTLTDHSRPTDSKVRFHSAKPVAEDVLERTDSQAVEWMRSVLGR